MSILREELAKKNLTRPSSIKQAGTSFHQTVLMDQPWVSKDLVVLYMLAYLVSKTRILIKKAYQ